MVLVDKSFPLPKDTLDAFEQKVEHEKQGELVASLIQHWLEEEHKRKIREEYIAGLVEMEDVSLELEYAYNPLEEEVHRGLPE